MKLNKQIKTDLAKAYQCAMEISILDMKAPLRYINQYISDNISGYGTAADEKVRSRQDYRKMLMKSRQQSKGMLFKAKILTPYQPKFTDETTAQFHDEILVQIGDKKNKHSIHLYMSCVFKYQFNKWQMVMFHGSMPDAASSTEDTFHVGEAEKKVKELEKIVAQRTLDLQAKNKELEIEASLERVRTVTMAMNAAGDILNICKIFFTELKALGFKDLRNALINFWDDENGLLHDYDYSDFAGGNFAKLAYSSHPAFEEFQKKIRKAKDAFAKLIIEKDGLKSWQQRRRSSGEYKDPRLNKIDALYYYFYSTGVGALGISTFKPISKDEVGILKKFRNVFDLAYLRYLEIEKAAAQAQEAKIEAALERVRSAAMSMRKSEELIMVCEAVYNELKGLGFESIRNAQISIRDTTKQNYYGTEYSDHIRLDMPNAPSNSSPIIKEIYDEIERSKDAFYQKEFTGKKFKEWRTWRMNMNTQTDSRLAKATSMWFYLYSIGQGYLGISTFNKITDNQVEILKRFKKVFELSYQRFTDVTNAEAQAREAQIELGLERVRARAMAMQKSDELSELVDTVFKELTKLDFALNWCIINIIDAPSFRNMVWAANPETNKPPESYLMKFEDFPFHHSMMKGYQERKTKHVYVLEGKEKKIYDDYLFNKTEWRRVPQAAQAASRAMKRYVATFTFSNFGGLQTVGEEYLSEENLDILSRFGKVFDLTYTRFNDLQKAEAQVREAQIEAALERVRSRSMAMHKSDELLEAGEILFVEMQKLGIESLTAGYVLMDKEEKNGLNYTPNPSTKKIMPLPIIIPHNETIHMQQVVENWKKGNTFFIAEMDEDETIKHQTFIAERSSNFPLTAAQLIAISPAKLFLHNFYFKEGYILIVGGTKLSAEQTDIMLRFAKVFQQTYTRFLDLQKAEAQAKEAQIEAALERVRSRSMAMHKSEELKEVIQIVYEQFVHLNVNTEHTGFVIDYKQRDDRLIWVASKHGVPSQLTIPYFDCEYYNSFNEAKEKGLDFFATNLSFEEKNNFYKQLFTYIPDLPEEAKEFYFNCPGLAISTVLLENVALYIENFEGISYSEEDNGVLMRFGKVFQQTYTRFLDLQKAEAQTREATIEASMERIRAKAMGMHHSDELDEVLVLLWEQFDVLGIRPMSAHMTVVDIPNNRFTFRETGKFGNRSFGEQIVDIDAMDIWKEAAEQWRRSEPETVNSLHFPKESLPTVWQVFHQSFSSMPEDSRITPDDYPDGIYHIAGKHPFGYIGINQIRKATNEEEQIVIRFASEFGRAYQRFLDLKKAEVQAREATIEMSLERVRAKTMAMHNSKDLLEVITLLSEQFQLLGFNIHSANFNTSYRKKDWDLWLYTPGTPMYPDQIHIPYFDHPYFNRTIAALNSGSDFNAFVFTKEEKDGFLDHIYTNTLAKHAIEERKQFTYAGKGFAWSAVYLKNTALTIANYDAEPYSEEQNVILRRFGNVFEQTYTRFLDLQKAEAQAKEAQIETALEKVRSRSLAMHKSDELQEVVNTLFEKLMDLDIEADSSNIAIFKEGTRDYDYWIASNFQKRAASFHMAYIDMSLTKDVVAARERGEDFSCKAYSFEEKNEWFNYAFKNTDFKHLTDERKQYILDAKAISVAIAYSKNTGIQINRYSGNLPAEGEIDILKRFAKVFEQAYIRFLDLQKAEAQAREAQIEAALEKVRSKTLAMQKSDELAETAAELFRQLIGLGIEPNRLYIGIVQGENGNMEMWATDEDGTHIGSKFLFNKNDNASVKKLYDGWKAQQKSVIVDMQGKELEEYFHYLSEVLHIPFKDGLSQERRVQSVAYFSKGFIGMASPDGQGEQTIQLLERFAAVFNLTFTRFNDLKIAEAHAEQAEQDLIAIKEAKQKAEEALTELQSTQKQLIQSEKMASLGELTAGIAHEIQNPLNFVNNFSEVSKELLDEMREAIEKGDTAEAKEIMNDVIQNLEKINHHGKRADGIVKGMLQHSRSSNGQKEATDINALCDEYLRLAYHGLRAKDKTFNATMKTDYDETAGKVSIIPQDIGRVILNLITNAFYVVAEKKRMGIAGYEPTVSVSTKKMDVKIEVSVKDNGNGIPAQVLDKIFQPFFTTKPTGQGTGLGLSLSYDIVKAHGGELKAETKEGEGSTFIIQIPVN